MAQIKIASLVAIYQCSGDLHKKKRVFTLKNANFVLARSLTGPTAPMIKTIGGTSPLIVNPLITKLTFSLTH